MIFDQARWFLWKMEEFIHFLHKSLSGQDEKERLIITFSKEIRKKFDDMLEEKGIRSESQIVGESLAIYDWLHEKGFLGRKVDIFHPDTQVHYHLDLRFPHQREDEESDETPDDTGINAYFQ